MDQALKEKRERIIREHTEAENRRDVGAVVKTFHKPFYDVVAMGAISDGPQAVAELMSGLFAGFPDFRAERVATYHAPDAVIAEIKMTGTHRGTWAGLPATGRSMELRSACIFKFDEDRLIGETVYFDFATLLRQLGAA
jgi:steroid delta-isomerase-like uncharacterized protein